MQMVGNGMQLCLSDMVLGHHPQASNLFSPGHSVPKERKEKGGREESSKSQSLTDG